MKARQPFLLLTIAALAACAQPTPAPAPAPPPVAGACNAQAAQFAVGQVATAELGERAMRAAGAQQYRFLRPGQAVTLEFNAGRLNLELDAAGKVLRVRCG
jgi:hypothetical protein